MCPSTAEDAEAEGSSLLEMGRPAFKVESDSNPSLSPGPTHHTTRSPAKWWTVSSQCPCSHEYSAHATTWSRPKRHGSLCV